jgi:signal transduction histidine kinase
MNDILPVAFLILLAVVTTAAIWLIGVNRRTAAANDASYRELLDRSVATQEATERRLGEVLGELAGISQRIATVEHILKDAE